MQRDVQNLLLSYICRRYDQKRKVNLYFVQLINQLILKNFDVFLAWSKLGNVIHIIRLHIFVDDYNTSDIISLWRKSVSRYVFKIIFIIVKSSFHQLYLHMSIEIIHICAIITKLFSLDQNQTLNFNQIQSISSKTISTIHNFRNFIHALLSVYVRQFL